MGLVGKRLLICDLFKPSRTGFGPSFVIGRSTMVGFLTPCVLLGFAGLCRAWLEGSGAHPNVELF